MATLHVICGKAGAGKTTLARELRSTLPAIVVASCIVSSSAFAHFHLDAPEDWLETNTYGDPQKTSPCGASGPESGAVTRVTAGSTLTLKWTETVGHPGHYRVALTDDRSTLVDPVATVKNNDCKSAAIEQEPSAPVIADGLFPHSSGMQGTQFTYELKVPDTPCAACTIQIVEFMSSHPPPCFYYHCANVEIVAADAGVDAGITDDAGTDAGAVVDAGAPGGGGNEDAGAIVHAEGGHSGSEVAGGCGCTSLSAETLPFAILFWLRRRKARRTMRSPLR